MTWRWLTPGERENRRISILELWQLGHTRQEIAARFDISPSRVSQIINSFGIRERRR